jgi:hypothetical protein
MVVLMLMTVLFGFAGEKGFLLKFHQALIDGLPPSFEGELQSSSISKKLGTIPKDMVAPGQKLRLVFLYQKGKGVQLQVRGLTKDGEELYGDIFQPYMRLFTLGPLLLGSPSANTWEGYTVTNLVDDEKSAILSLVPKNTANEYILYIDKQNLRLLRLDFKGSGFLTSTILKFTQKDGYWIPEVFLNKTITEDNPDPLPERYQLVNITIRK